MSGIQELTYTLTIMVFMNPEYVFSKEVIYLQIWTDFITESQGFSLFCKVVPQ